MELSKKAGQVVVTPKLGGPKTYRAWRENIELALGEFGLIPFAEGTVQKPPIGHLKRMKWEHLAVVTVRLMMNNVTQTINSDIMLRTKDPAEIWRSLEQQYGTNQQQIGQEGVKSLNGLTYSKSSGALDFIKKIERAFDDAFISIDPMHFPAKEQLRCQWLIAHVDLPDWDSWKTTQNAWTKIDPTRWNFRNLAGELQRAETERKHQNLSPNSSSVNSTETMAAATASKRG